MYSDEYTLAERLEAAQRDRGITPEKTEPEPCLVDSAPQDDEEQ